MDNLQPDTYNRPNRLVVMLSDNEWETLNEVCETLNANRSRLVRACLAELATKWKS